MKLLIRQQGHNTSFKEDNISYFMVTLVLPHASGSHSVVLAVILEHYAKSHNCCGSTWEARRCPDSTLASCLLYKHIRASGINEFIDGCCP